MATQKPSLDVNIRMAQDNIDEVDAWRRVQQTLMSRSEAIRQLVRKGLEADNETKVRIAS